MEKDAAGCRALNRNYYCIVAKIKKKRDNNEKIGQLLKTYGVAQLSDLPAEKYEAFLADVSQI